MLVSITLTIAIYTQSSSLDFRSVMSKSVMSWSLNSISSWISCLMAYNLVTRICIYLPQGSALPNTHIVSIVISDVIKVLFGFKDLLITVIRNDFSMCGHLILGLEQHSSISRRLFPHYQQVCYQGSTS